MPHPHRTAPLSLTGEEVDEYSQETRRQRTHRSGGAASGNAQHRTSRATALIHHATHWLWLPQGHSASGGHRQQRRGATPVRRQSCGLCPCRRLVRFPGIEVSNPCSNPPSPARLPPAMPPGSGCGVAPSSASLPASESRQPRAFLLGPARPLPTATVLLHHTHTHTRLRLLSSSSPFLPPPLQIASPVRPSLSPAHSLHSCTCHRIDQQLLRTSDLG